MRTRIRSWSATPIVIPRGALIFKYFLFAYFGAVSGLVGVPIFSLTAPVGYAVIWGALMLCAGSFGVYGSWIDDPRHETIEKWAVLVISSLMLPYVGSLNAVAFVSHDGGRQALAAGVTIILVIPITRFLSLARKSGTHPKKGATTE